MDHTSETRSNSFEVIIVGGSYAGLSAGMSLGRALRKVLIIDSGQPCNSHTPYAHNFITQDGQPPEQIRALAKAQVAQYDTVKFYNGLVDNVIPIEKGFTVKTQSGKEFTAQKLIFATGLRDIMPDITNFADCWGRSILHCPYCHGYEVRHEKTGILANGEMAFHFTRLISNWTQQLSLFTNGKSSLTSEQTDALLNHNISIIETEIDSIQHQEGQIQNLILKDATAVPLRALYAKIPLLQHCTIPEALGCELTEQGLLKVDMFQKTTVPGVFACGDCTTMGRSVVMAAAAGSLAGVCANLALVEDTF